MKTIIRTIIRNQNNGNEKTLNDSLMFGMGIYAYAEDVVASGIKYEDRLNDVFKTVPESELENFLSFLQNRDGYLAIN